MPQTVGQSTQKSASRMSNRSTQVVGKESRVGCLSLKYTRAQCRTRTDVNALMATTATEPRSICQRDSKYFQSGMSAHSFSIIAATTQSGRYLQPKTWCVNGKHGRATKPGGLVPAVFDYAMGWRWRNCSGGRWQWRSLRRRRKRTGKSGARAG